MVPKKVLSCPLSPLAMIFVLALLVMMPAPANGAQVPMRHFSTDEGLVNNEVITAFLDSKGYLWFGTYAGLSRFDGKRFKNYDEQAIGPGSTVIKAIVEDRQHRIWIGYSGGIARLIQDPNGDRFAVYTHKDGLLGRDIVGLSAHHDGGVWALTEQGINYFDGEKFYSKALEGIDASMSGTHLQCSAGGDVFVVAQERLWQLEQGPSNLAFIPCAQATFPVKGIRYHPREDALYVISANELYRYKDHRCELVAASPLEDELLTLAIGKNNKLWVISETMLWHRTPSDDTIYANEMLHGKSLSNLLEDQEGNLWLTTWSGISMLVHTGIRNYSDLPVTIVSGVLKDPDGHLWVAGDQGTLKLSPTNEVLLNNKSAFVEFIYYDEGKIFSGTDGGGLHVHDLQGNLLATHHPDEIFTCMLKDSSGKYWLGSYSGLYSFDKRTIALEIDTKGGLGSNAVWTLLEDSEHRLWVGTENGLSHLVDGQWRHFNTDHGLSHPSIWHLREHKDWGILVATGRGISRWQNDAFVTLPALSDMAIDNLATDPAGKLWVGTAQGVFRIDAEGGIELVLDKARGLPVNSTYFRTAFIDGSHLYIGTHKGLSRIEVDIENNKSKAPMLYAEEIHINKEPRGALIRPLEPFEKNITFFFHAVYMYLPDAVTYSYFLEGMDLKWSEKSGLRQAVYTNLSPGAYEFKVRAFAEDGKKSTVTSIKFKIRKAFWQTWWFLSLEILLGLFVVAAVSLRVGQRKVRKQAAYARQLEHTVAERTQTLAEARKAAEAANQAKSAFLAGMSHEIRTPLNGVVGMTEVLLNSELTDEQRSCAQTAYKSAEALLKIIDDILDFSKIEADAIELNSEPFDLMSTVEELGRLLSAKADGKGVELIVRYAPHLPKYFEGDAGRIRQVLLNLASNAVKFTEQGHVLVDVHGHEMTEDKAVIHMRVKDTGIGIPEKYLTSIFDRFTQTEVGASPKYGGTGLGLAISSQLVALMGGKIEVNSTPGRGSTFEFILTLPRVKPRTAAHAPATDLSGLRLIIVDDNEVSSEVLRERLITWGIRCDLARSVDEVHEKTDQAAAVDHPFDIALINHRLPEMSGTALAHSIKEQSALKDTLIILLSAVTRPPGKRTLAEAGVVAYLEKPVNMGQLFHLLQKVKAAQQEGQAAAFTDDALLIQKDASPIRFNAKILLVEDVPTNQKVALVMLNHLGCEVEIADTGEEAVERIQEGVYDMVFMDCHLPGMDGFEATHLIRKAELKKMKQAGGGSVKRVPIVAMTANALECDRERCLSAGMDEFLTKPISRNKLQEMLHKLLIPSSPMLAGTIRKVLIALPSAKECHLFEQIIGNLRPDAVIKYADSGIEACTLMAGFLPDLMILDDHLPGIDVVAMFEYLSGHGRFQSIQTIVATDLNEDDPRVRAMGASGCNHILRRPLSGHPLESIVEEIVFGAKNEMAISSESDLDDPAADIQGSGGQGVAAVLDHERLVLTFQGDTEMIKGYIDILMKDMPDVIQDLEAAITTDQMEMVEHQAHKVKNMAAESGGMRLCLLADAMEKAAVKGKRPFCEQQLPQLKTEFDMLVDAIQTQGWCTS